MQSPANLLRHRSRIEVRRPVCFRGAVEPGGLDVQDGRVHAHMQPAAEGLSDSDQLRLLNYCSNCRVGNPGVAVHGYANNWIAVDASTAPVGGAGIHEEKHDAAPCHDHVQASCKRHDEHLRLRRYNVRGRRRLVGRKGAFNHGRSWHSASRDERRRPTACGTAANTAPQGFDTVDCGRARPMATPMCGGACDWETTT